ncbi:MAG: hypothetical protein JWL69_4366 [Phycisphaerales bacterium]|nr:hypothetical protein [Phycisphaerales bacterium]
MAEAHSVTYVVSGPWWVPWAILAACVVVAVVLWLAVRKR